MHLVTSSSRSFRCSHFLSQAATPYQQHHIEDITHVSFMHSHQPAMILCRFLRGVRGDFVENAISRFLAPAATDLPLLSKAKRCSSASLRKIGALPHSCSDLLGWSSPDHGLRDAGNRLFA